MDSKDKKFLLSNLLCWPLILLGVIVINEVSVWVGIMIVIILFGVWTRLVWWFMND